MTKILHATSRGQITLPKDWRGKFKTTYYVVEIKESELVLKPLTHSKTLKDEVEASWNEYHRGEFIDADDLKKKYGV